MEKVMFTGTHRVRLPEDTLNVITPLFDHFGITRLADVTGLVGYWKLPIASFYRRSSNC